MYSTFIVLLAVVLVNGASVEKNVEGTIEENDVGNTRIRGGHLATKPYPYQVSLQVNASVYGLSGHNGWAHWCGAAIITNRVILTAAHCLTDFDDNNIPQEYYSVFAGSMKLSGDGIRYYLSENRSNENYIPPTVQNYDIGIIRTSTEIKFIPKRVQAIGYSDKETGGGVICMLTGWGNMGRNGNGRNPDNLQELLTPTLTNPQCKRRTGGVTDTDICTFTRYGQGHCFGDSGGPLVDEKNQLLVGLVSRAVGCGSGRPDIYTRVSFFYSWIQDFLNEN